jgi:hypothetical protein
VAPQAANRVAFSVEQERSAGPRPLVRAQLILPRWKLPHFPHYRPPKILAVGRPPYVAVYQRLSKIVENQKITNKIVLSPIIALTVSLT